MTTYEEFRNGAIHYVNYEEIAKNIIDKEKLWKWLDEQNYSEFERGIVVGFMIA